MLVAANSENETHNQEGGTMKKYWLIGLLVAALLVAAAGYGILRTASQASTLGPAEVVDAFYGWYLDYIGDRASDTFRNPLRDGAYRTSPYLAPEFVTTVDELIAGFEHGGYDPFLLAQDIPTEVNVGEAVVTGKTATVPVSTSFAGHHFTVTLALETDENWLITAITPAR
jgi:hypothetical protein